MNALTAIETLRNYTAERRAHATQSLERFETDVASLDLDGRAVHCMMQAVVEALDLADRLDAFLERIAAGKVDPREIEIAAEAIRSLSR